MLLLANYCVSHAQSSASPCLCSFTEWFRTHLSFGTLLAGGLLQNIIEFAAHHVTSQFASRMLVADQAAGDFSDEQSYVGGHPYDRGDGDELFSRAVSVRVT
eukprot:536500_1